MNRIFRILFLVVIFGVSENGYSQMTEICDNGVDDDLDGFIDKNDTTDCKCLGIKDSVFVPSSLIPNPSFEIYSKCPDGLMQMSNATGWIQASPATSDYFNLCGYKDDVLRGTPPQPLPAGKGYVGFLDIRNFPQRGIYKEYIGSCLTSTMSAGKEYTLTFWVGFGRRGTLWGPRATLNMGIFATGKCSNLPFATNPQGWQCPTRYAGWFEMSRITVSGTNVWRKVTVKLRPTVNVEAIALGPACAATDGDYYYWMDELILEETVKFDSLKVDISGNFCVDTIRLKSSKSSQVPINYQWYKNGIAVQGADQKEFNIPKGDVGIYSLRVTYKNQCEYSKPFDYKIDQFLTSFKSEICEGDTVSIAGKNYLKAGSFRDTLKTALGCDSILEISIEQFKKFNDNLNFTICQGDSLLFDGIYIKDQNSYNFNYFTDKGCDSIVTVNLQLLSKDTTDSEFKICEGSFVEIDNNKYDKPGDYSLLFKNRNNCDSLLRFRIIHQPVFSSNLNRTICSGDFVEVGQKRYVAQGKYIDTLRTFNNCDSIVVLDLIVNPNNIVNIDTALCEGESFRMLGVDYDKTGSYTVKALNSYSCDSIITLNLNVRPVQSQIINRTICEGDFVEVGDVFYWKTGTYDVKLANQFNCDSLIQLQLLVNPIQQTKIDTAICYGQELILGTKRISSSGAYTYKEKSFQGCDSTVLVNLQVAPPIEIQHTVIPTLCATDSNGQIIVQIVGGTQPYNVKWQTGDTALHLKNLKGGYFFIEVIDEQGCIVTKEIELPSPPCFCFNVNPIQGNCLDPNGGSVFIQQVSGNVAKDYFINGVRYPPSNDYIKNLKLGNYNLTIVDSNGCYFNAQFDIQFDSSYVQEFEGDTILATVGDSIELFWNSNGSVNAERHIWTGSGDIFCEDCKIAKVLALPGITKYYYIGKDEYGCEVRFSRIVIAKQGHWVPNVFSPNGDGINDFFNLISDSSVGIIDRLQIFSRWGELIFESKNGIPNTQFGAWNGNFLGEPVNPGVYVYAIYFHDKVGKSFRLSGDVTVVR
ncbi:MAG: T9SS type B sorting domain-containing protein [Saprospiraceae bacterium]|nr:T9SS type B sorting domain-containing protein [Saprospiraceae bacterium]